MLVPSKTKLLGFATSKQKHSLEHAKLINPVTINSLPVKFVDEVEHVGVIRNTSGNMPNIANRITSHKKAMASVLSAGLAKNHNGNPMASLKVHQLYGTPFLFSGLATLVLTKPEITLIDGHYQKTVRILQKLHDKTPKSIVFLLAGCLPGEAILHQKHLTLFLMICHLPNIPLNYHGLGINRLLTLLIIHTTAVLALSIFMYRYCIVNFKLANNILDIRYRKWPLLERNNY